MRPGRQCHTRSLLPHPVSKPEFSRVLPRKPQERTGHRKIPLRHREGRAGTPSAGPGLQVLPGEVRPRG